MSRTIRRKSITCNEYIRNYKPHRAFIEELPDFWYPFWKMRSDSGHAIDNRDGYKPFKQACARRSRNRSRAQLYDLLNADIDFIHPEYGTKSLIWDFY